MGRPLVDDDPDVTREIAARRSQIAAAAAVSTAGLVLPNLAEFGIRILIGRETLGPLVFGGSGSFLGATKIHSGAER